MHEYARRRSARPFGSTDHRGPPSLRPPNYRGHRAWRISRTVAASLINRARWDCGVVWTASRTRLHFETGRLVAGAKRVLGDRPFEAVHGSSVERQETHRSVATMSDASITPVRRIQARTCSASASTRHGGPFDDEQQRLVELDCVPDRPHRSSSSGCHRDTSRTRCPSVHGRSAGGSSCWPI